MRPGLANEGDRTHVRITAHRRRQKLPLVPLSCNRLGEQRFRLLQMRLELRAEPFDPVIRLFEPRFEILDARIGLIRREKQRAPTEPLELQFQRLLPSSRYDGPRPTPPTESLCHDAHQRRAAREHPPAAAPLLGHRKILCGGEAGAGESRRDARDGSPSLKKAVKDRLLTVNPVMTWNGSVRRRTQDRPPASTAGRPSRRGGSSSGRAASPQLAAYVYLALDPGRKVGTRWPRLGARGPRRRCGDHRTTAGTRTPGWISGRRGAGVWPDEDEAHAGRHVLGEETIARLKAHRKARPIENEKPDRLPGSRARLCQGARRPPDPDAQTGQPLTTLSGRRFQALANEAGVKRIKFHGCRHTVATLSLAAGTPPHVVAARLGHSVLELMKTYAHALPDQQQDAATRLGRLLHG